MSRWTIMGWYWKGLSNDEHPVEVKDLNTFVGEVDISEDGKFRGTLRDRSYGLATIEGRLSQHVLEFKKKYTPEALERGGAEGEIFYSLRPRTILVEGVKISTGWKGVYSAQNACGKTACMLCPLPQ